MDYTNATIEKIFKEFKPIMGIDYDKYRNHVYRVFQNCLLIDRDKQNEEKYAIAAAFHDIGIWTNHTIDYLNPSMQQASMYLSKNGTQDWTDEINLMIDAHHKISKYEGRFEKTVESFRKADWIDVSLGLVRFGIDSKKISMNRKQLPNHGFHVFLMKKIAMNFFKHPFTPLPMFKR